MFTDRKSICEILKTQFKSVFTKKTTSKIPVLPGVTFPSIEDLKSTEFGVFKLLDKIDVSKVSGLDCTRAYLRGGGVQGVQTPPPPKFSDFFCKVKEKR